MICHDRRRLYAPVLEFVDFFLLLATAALGFAGAAWWTVIGTTIGLYSLSWERWQQLGARAKHAGAKNVFALVMLARLGLAFAAALAAFVLRYALRFVSGL
jgi:hypothetical protein